MKDAETKRAVLVIEEATGKRISRLFLAKPYPKSQEIYLVVEFDDDTEIEIDIDVASRLSFLVSSIMHATPMEKWSQSKNSSKGRFVRS